MYPEYLVCDLDGRWKEQERNGKSPHHRKSDPLKWSTRWRSSARSSPYVKTIIFDSGTAVLDFIQSKGRLEEAPGEQQKYNIDKVNR